ncbi:1-aminocyclopropane-1-carboxylate deaminase [Trichophyton violaceum]|uniref:1-aminocyclopropane-1-carboxylate deaminase n=1 Tax=Trichophyton violaceum TaxID=34388 RepID=A0A178FS50_TRIVO|nr:1-aminocyclopropane-1-carboxylate deaminase [Trichophyton violaceum]
MVKLPEPFAAIPRQELLLGPSPIHLLPRMTADLGGQVRIYAKRDDVSSGLAYGGNKTRKLEYLAADAVGQGCDTLVSIGGIQSNHTRQVAAVAARMGLKCGLVQEKWVEWADPGYEKVGNIQLSYLMGADVRIEKMTSFGIEHKGTLKSLVKEYEAKGQKPYYIPAGASDHPLGGLGFARWAFELIEKLYPDEPRKKIIGIDGSATPEKTRAQVLRIARGTAEKIGLKADDITEADIVLDERYHAGTYGVPDKQTWEAIEYGARMDAFITDPVYEGKSLAGLLGYVRNGEIKAGNILYAHLGGQLALNAYSQLGHVE